MVLPIKCVGFSTPNQDPSHSVLDTRQKAMGHATVCGAIPDDGPDSKACGTRVKEGRKKARSSESRRKVALHQVWKQTGQLGVERRIS